MATANVNIGRSVKIAAGSAVIGTINLQVNSFVDVPQDQSPISATKVVIIEPSNVPTRVQFTSYVTSYTPEARKSKAFVAAVRRKAVSAIIKKFIELPLHSAKDDFASYIYVIADDIRILIQKISENEEAEGNSAAVLRLLRNTLLDGRYSAYKSDGAIKGATATLHLLLASEDIDSEIVRKAADLLHAGGLQFLIPVDFDDAIDHYIEE